MGLEIDIEDFLAQLTATKPPYTCPFETCNKTYKSYPGIAQHMKSHEPVNPDSAATGDGKKKGASSGRNRSPSGSEYGSSTAREALTYAEAQRMIEVEIDGRTHRINICESLDIIKEDKNAKMNGLIADESDKTIGVSDSVEAEVKGTKGKSGAKNGFQGRSSKSGKKGKGKSTKTMAKVKAKSMASPEKPKLPEASFRKVDNPIEVPEALPRPAAYYRYTEKPIEELDESVEYDMDEEDCAWLDIINKDRRSKKLPEVPADTFELLMDRLEKESYFLSKDSKDHLAPAIDEDAVCCICNDGDCQNSNAILFCDMCDLAVHQECYGVPYIPEGQWLCRRCLNSPSAGVDCVLCPNKGGAFKQTDKSEWAHVVCAIWIPEVCFANTVFLEPIDSIDNIPQARWRLNCYICKQKGIGACIQCHKPNCYTAFHVTCAQSAGIFMHIDVDKNRNGVQSIRKAAYCHVHTPADETAGTQIALSGVYSTREEDFSRSTVKTKNKKSSKIPLADRILAATETEFTEKIKKARKILAEKRSAPTQVSIPTIPPERLTAIVEKMTLPKRNQFIQRLLGYWTLKRQSRNGVPLLRRLQISYSGSRRAPGEAVEVDSEAVKKQKEEHKSMQRLRQDLERARLLVELIRKREKTKRHVMELLQAVTESHLQPFKLFLRQIVKQLSQKDTNRFFQNPVSVADAPDYFEYISEPMDFSTMASKVEKCEYESLEALEGDFNLMIDNCKSYNDPETIYFKAANKLKDLCRPIFRDAKSMIQTIGFNEKAGIHDPPVSMTEIPLSLGTQTVNDTTSSEMVSPNSAEQALKKRHDTLTAVLEKTMEMKSGGSRTVKIRDYRDEIAEIERSLHVLNPSLYPAPPTDPRTSPSSKRKESPDKSSCTPNKKVKTTPLPPPSTSKSPRTPKRDVISDSEATDIYSPSPKKSMKKLKASNQHDDCSPKAKRKLLEETPVKHASQAGKKIKKQTSKDQPRKPTSKAIAAKRKRLTSSTSADIDDSDQVSENSSLASQPNSRSRTSLKGTDAVKCNGISKKKKAEKTKRFATSDASRESSLDSDDEMAGMPLQHFDLVWVQSHEDLPWYPAMIVVPEMLKASPNKKIPTPPKDLVSPKRNRVKGKHLILTADKNKWDWVSRSRVEPLGVDEVMDKVKQNQPRKASDKKLVEKAYERALLLRCRVTGEANDSDLHSDESSE